jgi:bacteriocin biosynthesis cyclodehydratase domain-containing protein
VSTVQAQARLPQRSPKPWPRLARSLAVIPVADGVIIDGGQRRIRLGSARSTMLCRLVSLLDGHRSPESVCRQLGVTHEQLDRVIGKLREEGLIEFAPSDEAHWPLADHVFGYLARAGRATEEYKCVEELLASLAEAAVLLVAVPPWIRCIAADLTEVGIGQVVVRANAASVTETDLTAAVTAHRAVIAVWDDTDDPAAFDAFMIQRAGMPVPILRVAADTGHAEIGPLFLDGHSPCVACFRRGQRGLALARQAPEPAGGGTSSVADDVDASLAGSLVVTEILALATQMTQPLAPGRMLRLAYGDLAITTFDVSPDPECPCSGGPPDDAAAIVETYEYSMALRPARLAWSATETLPRRKMATSLQLQRTSYPWAPRRQLPAASYPLADPHAEPGDGSPPMRIGSLMRAVAGTRADATQHMWEGSGLRSRWAPTGGNLASVELFAITGSQIFELPGNVFKYDDLEHAVISVRRDTARLPELLASTDLPDQPVDLLLVLVAALGRVRQKYGEFSLRLAHLDAGCAALQLAMMAPQLGLKAAFAASWTPAVATELELDPQVELVTAIAGVTIQGGHQWG